MKNWFIISRNRNEDYSSYQDGLSSNGGAYAFFEDTLILKSEDEYRKLILHKTSSELPYCSYLGNFTTCQICEIMDAYQLERIYISNDIIGYDENGYLNSTQLYIEEISTPISEEDALEYLEKLTEEKVN